MRLFLVLFLLATPLTAHAQIAGAWQPVPTDTDGNKRHENAFVQIGDKFYLVGGRGMKPIDIYDPATKTWSQGAQPPLEMHHFQAVAHHGLLYVVGAFTGGWPNETPLANIYLYDPAQDRWIVGPEVPAHRRRGAAGVVVHDDKLYVVCGIVNGHQSHWVPWLDVYDPATGTWTELPDAPRARDHFMAAVVDGQLYAAGGRRSGSVPGAMFGGTVAEVDVYDIEEQTWRTLPSPKGDIPTQRAGTGVAVVSGEVIVVGGESDEQGEAHEQVEALNPSTETWRALPSLVQGRHGTQVINTPEGLYVAGGCANRGGSPEIVALEHLAVAMPSYTQGERIPIGIPVEGSRLETVAVEPMGMGKARVTIANAGGNQALVIAHALVHGGGQVEAGPDFPHILAPGALLKVDVSFDPEAGSELVVKALKRGAPVVVPLSERHAVEYMAPMLVETGGHLIAEAEAFVHQANTSQRQWYVTGADSLHDVGNDPDGNNAAGASGGVYLEALPDTRMTHDDPLVDDVSFANTPGRMGTLTYYAHVKSPGRYYVWVRTHTSGTEDNGIHVGLNGTWPASGQRMQFDGNKQAWSWESRQRTEEVHTGVPELIYLDIPEAGIYSIQFAMREDGFEFDQWALTPTYAAPE